MDISRILGSRLKRKGEDVSVTCIYLGSIGYRLQRKDADVSVTWIYLGSKDIG